MPENREFTYRTPRVWMVWWGMWALILVPGGAILLAVSLLDPQSTSTSSSPSGGLAAMAIMCLGMGLWALAFYAVAHLWERNGRVLITDAGLTVRSWLGQNTAVAWHDVREMTSSHVPFAALMPLGPRLTVEHPGQPIRAIDILQNADEAEALIIERAGLV